MLATLGWGLYIFGIMITTVAITSYCLDSYPEVSGEVAAWLNFARTTGGFIVSYLQVRWAKDSGPAKSFGTQAGICLGAFLLVLIMQVWGRKWRHWAGPVE